MNRIILAALLALGLCAPAHAKIPSGSGTTYYISPTGLDSNNGTSTATPWQTLAKVNGFAFACGDTILFQGGQTFTGRLNFATVANWGGSLTGSCTPINPRTVASYGSGRATLHGAANPANFTDGIDFSDIGGWVVHDLIIVGPGDCCGANGGGGINLNNDTTANLNFFYFYNIDISGYNTGFAPTVGSASNNSGFTNLSCVNCTIHDNTSTGILFASFNNVKTAIASVNVYFDMLTIYNNTGQYANSDGSGNTWGGSGIFIGWVNGAVVRRFSIHNNGALNAAVAAGIWASAAGNVIIQNGEVYNNNAIATLDGEGSGFDGDVRESVIEYVYAHGNGGSCFYTFQYANPITGVGSSNNKFRYNVCEGNGRNHAVGEIALGASGAYGRIEVYGNTAYATGTNMVVNIGFNGTGLNGINGIIANNIFNQSVATNRVVDTNALNPTALQFQGNDYIGSTNVRWNNVSYTTIATWLATVTTEETYRGSGTQLTSSPSLTSAGNGGTCYTVGAIPLGPQPCPSAYTLSAGSAMLNAGQSMTGVFGIQPGLQDFYGNIVPAPSSGAYDVGANQKTQ